MTDSSVTPEAIVSADGVKCRATFCFRPIVEAERDKARAALDRALTVLAQLTNVTAADCRRGHPGRELIWQNARAVLAELQPEDGDS